MPGSDAPECQVYDRKTEAGCLNVGKWSTGGRGTRRTPPPATTVMAKAPRLHEEAGKRVLLRLPDTIEDCPPTVRTAFRSIQRLSVPNRRRARRNQLRSSQTTMYPFATVPTGSFAEGQIHLRAPHFGCCVDAIHHRLFACGAANAGLLPS